MILILGKKIHFRENWLIFLGILGEAELFSWIWGAKANNFREKRKLFSGIWGDQCIIFRDLGSTPPPPLGGLNKLQERFILSFRFYSSFITSRPGLDSSKKILLYSYLVGLNAGESSDTSMSTCDEVGHITVHWKINKTLASLLLIGGVVVTDKWCIIKGNRLPPAIKG